MVFLRKFSIHHLLNQKSRNYFCMLIVIATGILTVRMPQPDTKTLEMPHTTPYLKNISPVIAGWAHNSRNNAPGNEHCLRTKAS